MQSKKETDHLASSLVSTNNIRLRHLRMAHLNISDLQKLPNYADGVVLDQNKQVRLQCSSCCEGKQARLPFKQVGTRATKPLELIHSDLCGSKKIVWDCHRGQILMTSQRPLLPLNL